MIVVDTSALIAILEGEPEAPDLVQALTSYDAPLLSAASLIEAGVVLTKRHGRKAVEKLGALIEAAGIDVEPVTPEQASTAIEAFARFGKGLHKAGLNYGDCFAYALAKTNGLPLLFKGDAFTHTDLKSARTARV